MKYLIQRILCASAFFTTALHGTQHIYLADVQAKLQDIKPKLSDIAQALKALSEQNKEAVLDYLTKTHSPFIPSQAIASELDLIKRTAEQSNLLKKSLDTVQMQQQTTTSLLPQPVEVSSVKDALEHWKGQELFIDSLTKAAQAIETSIRSVKPEDIYNRLFELMLKEPKTIDMLLQQANQLILSQQQLESILQELAKTAFDKKLDALIASVKEFLNNLNNKDQDKRFTISLALIKSAREFAPHIKDAKRVVDAFAQFASDTLQFTNTVNEKFGNILFPHDMHMKLKQLNEYKKALGFKS